MNEVFVAICEWYGETNQYGEFKSTDLLGVFSDRQAASDACREHTAELEQDGFTDEEQFSCWYQSACID